MATAKVVAAVADTASEILIQGANDGVLELCAGETRAEIQVTSADGSNKQVKKFWHSRLFFSLCVCVWVGICMCACVCYYISRLLYLLLFPAYLFLVLDIHSGHTPQANSKVC